MSHLPRFTAGPMRESRRWLVKVKYDGQPLAVYMHRTKFGAARRLRKVWAS